jgi:flagellin
MRINHNIPALIGSGFLADRAADLGKSLEKLSTGLRINRASDDAAGLSVSETMRAKIRGMKQAKSNAQDGISLFQIAEGAAGAVGGVLQRMRELAIQSANDTMTTTERSYTDKEYAQLLEEVTRIVVSTQYNGQSLLDWGPTSFGFPGASSSVLHIGSGSGPSDRLSIRIDELEIYSFCLNLAGSSIATGAGALSSLSLIDNAVRSVNTVRSDLGAYVNRLEFAIEGLDNQIFNTQDAESRVRDVDFARETAEFTRAQILSQSATAMMAQANQAPRGVLSLLGA